MCSLKNDRKFDFMIFKEIYLTLCLKRKFYLRKSRQLSVITANMFQVMNKI